MAELGQGADLVVAVLVAEGVTATDAVNAAEALAMVPGAAVKFVGPQKGPKRTFLWSLPGYVLIVLVWAWNRRDLKKVRATEHEVGLKKIESEVEQLAGHRPTASRKPRPKR